MELSALKSLFFVGEPEEIDSWIAEKGLKPRQVLESPRFYEVDLADGTKLKQRTVFYRETGSYFTPDMIELKECSTSKANLGCGQLKKAEEISEYKIFPELRRRSDTRYYKNSEVLCSECAKKKLVKLYKFDGTDFVPTDWYAYANSSKLMKVHVDGTNIIYTTTAGNQALCPVDLFGENRAEQSVKVRYTHRLLDVVENSVKYQPVSEYWLTSSLTPVYASESARCPLFFPTEDVERLLQEGKLKQCSCGKIYPTGCFNEEGKCPVCGQPIKIWPYHGWDGDLEFLHGEGEEVSDNTLYFGFELETVGSRDNKKYVAPYQNMFHLERDGSLPSESFEIISQPMTWQYIMEHKDQISEMLHALDAAGQNSHTSDKCGLHVHVSRKAFKDAAAEKRAVAIVNALRVPMSVFARRTEPRYAAYSSLDRYVTAEALSRVSCCGHSVAVNVANRGGDKDTVEFRMFRGTLIPETLFAAIEMCRNIVNLANEEKLVVSFRDCCSFENSQYITTYIQKQESEYHKVFQYDYNVNFVGLKYPNWEDKVSKALASGNQDAVRLFESFAAGGAQ